LVREFALIGANKNEEGYDFLDRNKSLSRKGFAARRGEGAEGRDQRQKEEKELGPLIYANLRE